MRIMEVPPLTWAIVLLGPVVVLGVALYSSVTTDIKELKENWVKYRCYPIYMPFAEMIDPEVDVSENFQYCMGMFGQAVMDAALDPVYALFDVVNSIIGDLQNSTNIFRTIFTKISNVMLSVVGDIFGKLLNTFGSLTGEIRRIRDINARVTSSAWYLGFIGQSAVDMIMSVVQMALSLIKTLVIMLFALAVVLLLAGQVEILATAIILGSAVGISYCFDPDTPVELRSGDVRRLSEIAIGDKLVDGTVVEGVLEFHNHPGIEVYSLDGIVVSGYHKIHHEGKCIYVRDHPSAVPTKLSSPTLICLITDTSKIPLRGVSGTIHPFADYEEDMTEEVTRKIELLVWGKLMGETCLPALSPSLYVKTITGDMLQLREVKIGDVLETGDVVDGVVTLDGSELTWVSYKDFAITSSQPVQVHGGERTLAYKSIQFLPDNGSPIGVSLILRGRTGWFPAYSPRGECFVVRDYLETHDPVKLQEMERIVLENLNENTNG